MCCFIFSNLWYRNTFTFDKKDTHLSEYLMFNVTFFHFEQKRHTFIGIFNVYMSCTYMYYVKLSGKGSKRSFLRHHVQGP